MLALGVLARSNTYFSYPNIMCRFLRAKTSVKYSFTINLIDPDLNRSPTWLVMIAN